MTTMMLASMMTGVKVGDEPSFLPKTMSDGDLSAISIENDNIAGRRDAAERDNSSSTLGDVDHEGGIGTEQLVAVNFDKADIDSSGSAGMRKSTSIVSFHSSCLKKSTSRSSLAGSSKEGGMRRISSNVSFGSVSVREHERVVDDQPALPGPALGLGWAYNQKDDVHLDEYKKDKQGDKEQSNATDGKDGDEPSSEDDTNSKKAEEKKYIEQPLSSFARSVKLRSYGFEHNELKTDAQKAREALAEGKRRAEMARRKKEQKKLSYKVKKALRYFVTSES